MADYLMKKAATQAGQGFIRGQVAKMEGYYITAPNRDERGKKLSKKDRYNWEFAAYKSEGIPLADLKILMKVKAEAKSLDAGRSIGPLKFGVASIWGLVPVVGDFADVLLAYYKVYLPSRKISKGDDLAAFKLGMKVRIVALGCIGTLPVVGDFADTLIKWNMKNAAALEKLLLKRAGYFERISKAKVAKKNARRQQTPNRRSDEPELPPPRYEDKYHGHSAPSALQNGDRAPSAITSEKTVKSNKQASKTGGGWLAGLRSRETDGRERVVEKAEVAPQRPPRPIDSTHGRNQF